MILIFAFTLTRQALLLHIFGAMTVFNLEDHLLEHLPSLDTEQQVYECAHL